ncbi:hypothetical protein B0J11DRAFT_129544 [Dendryphion nanum]|uniref:Uncharacterized protein n=1 Tax=Dendryphion nanum TaxID=256645 RepID=A0A9P9DAK7_9PLEO|nr:hypothetical protein B0J11DRAFT_129544 [Dendryphion nanum]
MMAPEHVQKGISGSEHRETTNEHPVSAKISTGDELKNIFLDLFLEEEHGSHSGPPTKLEAIRPFKIFYLPREIRDQIYYHYLHRPKGVPFRRSAMKKWAVKKDGVVLTLFLTSKQVHNEALEVFCRFNVIEFAWQNKLGNVLGGLLKMVPLKTRNMLQLVRKPYDKFESFLPSWNGPWIRPKPEEIWIQMIRDAYTMRSHFPKLREFTAVWINRRFVDEETDIHMNSARGDEQLVNMWGCWMRKWLEVHNLVPPKWLRIEFQTNYTDSIEEMQQRQCAFQAAHRRLID